MCALCACDARAVSVFLCVACMLFVCCVRAVCSCVFRADAFAHLHAPQRVCGICILFTGLSAATQVRAEV